MQRHTKWLSRTQTSCSTVLDNNDDGDGGGDDDGNGDGNADPNADDNRDGDGDDNRDSDGDADADADGNDDAWDGWECKSSIRTRCLLSSFTVLRLSS